MNRKNIIYMIVIIIIIGMIPYLAITHIENEKIKKIESEQDELENKTTAKYFEQRSKIEANRTSLTTFETPLVIAIDSNVSIENIREILSSLDRPIKVSTKYGEKNSSFKIRNIFKFETEEYGKLKDTLNKYVPEPVGESVGIIFVNSSNHDYNDSICCESTHKFIVFDIHHQSNEEIKIILSRELSYLIALRFTNYPFDN